MQVKRFASIALAGLVALATVALAGSGFAAEPQNWQLGFQEPVTPVKETIHDFHNLLLVIITAITVFVLALLVYVILRFRESRNPTPSRTSHNTLVEIVWTVVPVIILVVIAVPSFRLLYYMDKMEEAEMAIKVTGHQWYWNYAYPGEDGLAFDSYMLGEDQLEEGDKRLLSVDNPLVVPADTTIRVLVAGADVLHSWLVPALGIQLYTVPGRVNETWMRIEEPGTYYGQCNQVCGVNHAYMPVVVKALPPAEYDKWLEEAKQRFAAGEPLPEVEVAAAR